MVYSLIMNENNESYKKVMRKLLSGHIASLKKKKKKVLSGGFLCAHRRRSYILINKFIPVQYTKNIKNT